MKHLLLVVSLLLVAGLAFGQNTSTITQNNPGPSGNPALLGSDAFVTQVGNGNVSTILQDMYNNLVTLHQTGTANTSYIKQLSDLFPTNGMKADVWQTGTANLINIDMKEHQVHNSVVNQNGVSNQGYIVHERNLGQSNLYQNGVANFAQMRVHAIAGSLVLVNQVGTSNNAVQNIGFDGTPAGQGNEMKSYQDGTLHHSYQTVYGVAPDDFIAHATDDNKGTILQHNINQTATQIFGNGTIITDENTSTIEQWGANNVAATTQIGHLNGALVNQSGAGNISNSLQTGLDNSVNVNQSN